MEATIGQADGRSTPNANFEDLICDLSTESARSDLEEQTNEARDTIIAPRRMNQRTEAAMQTGDVACRQPWSLNASIKRAGARGRFAVRQQAKHPIRSANVRWPQEDLQAIDAIG